MENAFFKMRLKKDPESCKRREFKKMTVEIYVSLSTQKPYFHNLNSCADIAEELMKRAEIYLDTPRTAHCESCFRLSQNMLKMICKLRCFEGHYNDASVNFETRLFSQDQIIGLF